MTEPKPVQIVKALRERLEDADFTVHLGKQVDPHVDNLPTVIVGMTDDGVATVERRRPKKDQISLYGELYFRIYQKPDEDDPLVQGLTVCDDLAGALVDRPERDGVDNLDGLADEIHVQRMVVATEHEESTIGLAQVRLDITYYDEG